MQNCDRQISPVSDSSGGLSLKRRQIIQKALDRTSESNLKFNDTIVEDRFKAFKKKETIQSSRLSDFDFHQNEESFVQTTDDEGRSPDRSLGMTNQYK